MDLFDWLDWLGWLNFYEEVLKLQVIFSGGQGVKILDRIEVNPEILHGKPHIAGTRVPVDIILGLLADGLTPEEIIKEHYLHITKEDILACIKYAEQLVKEEEIYFIEATG